MNKLIYIIDDDLPQVRTGPAAAKTIETTASANLLFEKLIVVLVAVVSTIITIIVDRRVIILFMNKDYAKNNFN